jgi:hypothetical protein
VVVVVVVTLQVVAVAVVVIGAVLKEKKPHLTLRQSNQSQTFPGFTKLRLALVDLRLPLVQ